MVSGAISVVSGSSQPTLLFQAAKGVGLSDNAASWAELAVNLSPSMPGVAREVGDLANRGLTKLYDLRKKKKRLEQRKVKK